MTREHPAATAGQPPIHPKYRPDIDGLRAVAVLSVVAFHAFPGSLRGGFVGVDIFFVISGYLISTIICEGLRLGSFTFAGFYGRRIRRIFPALLLVLAFVFAVGWFILTADEMKQLGLHVAAGAGFVSNFALMGESGYFDTSADAKPLLHLWSLGIEEQFYIVWPVLLWLAARMRVNMLGMAVIIAATSFALNIALRAKDPVGIFFSPQTRFWELLAGAMLAHLTLYALSPGSAAGGVMAALRAPIPLSAAKVADVASITGAALIAFAVGFIASDRAYPGWWALLPVAGSALLIAAGPGASINRTVLSNPVLVWVGLISFPLYLWHWPLLSLARIFEGATPGTEVRTGAVVAAFVLAWATLRFVETPIRHGRHGAAKAAMLSALMIAAAAVGLAGFVQGGFPERPVAALTRELTAAKADWGYKETTLANGVITGLNRLQGASEDSVLFIGDSLMGQYYPRAAAIYSAAPRPTYSTVFASRNHCRPQPFMSVISGPDNINCLDYYAAAMALAREPVYKKVVLAGNWSFAANDRSLAASDDQLVRDLAALRGLGKQIAIIAMPPHSPEFEPSRLARPLRMAALWGGNTTPPDLAVPRAAVELADLATQVRMRGIAERAGAILINPYDSHCPQGQCPYQRDGRPVYLDALHMRASYARIYSTFIDELVGVR